MARGRMLNRKISVDSIVAKLINDTSAAHGLVLTWMIAHLDRDGRITGDPLAIKGLVAPMVSAITLDTVTETVAGAADLGLIEVYEDARGQRFIWFPKFETNQVGLRYSREPVSDFPNPEDCRKIAGTPPEVSRKSSGSLPAEGKGIEGNRREGKGKESMSRSSNEPDRAIRVSTTIIKDIWDWYRRYHPRARLGEKERRAITARLKEGFSPDDLKQAIDGYHRSPFHCGENPKGRTYQSAGLIFRDSDHVTSGIEYATAPAEPVLNEATKRTLRATQSWAEKKMQEAKDAGK